MNYHEKYLLWCKNVKDESLKKQLESIKNDDKNIENRFFKDLQFGTGGLRGEIGVGSNCLNIYTIGKATQGLADYLKTHNGKFAAVSYDSRINSLLFARHTACVLAENGIAVHMVRELMPTPFLSFATRYYKCDAGIMITASHNPAKYNGYKVYNSDGCQITDNAAKEIISFIDRIDCFDVKVKNFENYISSNQITYMDDAVEQHFLNAVIKKSVGAIRNLGITYSPLNGTGYKIIPKMLRLRGVKDLVMVQEQSYPDGNFPTCPYPNPEKKEAMQLGIEYARKNNSDIFIATDPDADRVGVAVKNGDDYCLMSGNEIGVLLLDFIAQMKYGNNSLKKNSVAIKTIVTTNLAQKIADHYNIKLINVLTGFKYIGEQITKLESAGESENFILGFEESYGYLAGDYVRDKDSVIATMLILEMASYYKGKGLTLRQKMDKIYEQYGTYTHKLLSFEFPGADGAQKMNNLLDKIRKNNVRAFADKKIIKITDYLTQTQFDLPKSNVIQFDLEDNAQIIIRPSGTEPLIKIYITSALTPDENSTFINNAQSILNDFFK